MKVRDFGKETNVFLLDTSELDLNATGKEKGLRGIEHNALPSIGEIEAWFLFECPFAIEQVGLDKIIDTASEEFNIQRDVMEPLMMLIVSGLKHNPEGRNSLFKSLSGKEID